jgi:hypothetical protein
MLKEDFTSKIEIACHNAADTILKNKLDHNQEGFEVAIQDFSRSINNFICVANDSSEKDKILMQSATTLLNTIAKKCPFLTERNHDDLLVLTTETQRKISNTILDSELSMYQEYVKYCLVNSSLAHEYPNGINPTSRKILDMKDPQCFANEQLLFSAKNGNNNDLKNLIKKGADVHYRKDRALIKAAESGNTEGVKILVENGADFKLNHFEALRICTKNKHMGTSLYLISLDRKNSLQALKDLTYTSDETWGELMDASSLYEKYAKPSTLKQ